MTEDQSSAAWPLIKVGLIGLGALAAIGLAITIVKPVLILGAIAAVGYAGYRLVGSGGGTKQLDADSDYKQKMRALEAAEKKYDDQIR